MASEETRRGRNQDWNKAAVGVQTRLGKGRGILVSPHRIVVIRDGQFVRAVRGRSNSP